MKKKSNGRAGTLAEVDVLIEELHSAQRSIDACSRAPTVDLTYAINHAMRVRQLIELAPDRSGWMQIQQSISFLLKVVKEIHSLFNCFFSQFRLYERWINYKAA